MDRAARLRRLSKAMGVFCLLAIVAFPLGQALLWLVFEPCAILQSGAGDPTGLSMRLCGDLDAPANLEPFAIDGALPYWQRAGGFLIAMLPTAAALYGLFALRRLFRLYAEGQVFSPANTRAFRRFALAVFAFALARPIAFTLTVLLLTIDNPPGQRMLSFSLGDGDLLALFLGGLFLVIAWVMDEGRALAEAESEYI